MKLKTIQLKNYRCFEDSGVIPVYDMTIVIGANDCGKSSILRALGLFFRSPKCVVAVEDFRKVDGIYMDSMEIELVFSVEEGDSLSDCKRYIVNNELTAKKVFLKNTSGVTERFLVRQNSFQHEDLNKISELKMPALKELCAQYKQNYTTVEETKKALIEFTTQNYDALPKKTDYPEADWSKIYLIIPSFELYDSANYGNPQALVQKTLSEVYRSFFYTTIDGVESTLPFLAGKEEEIKNTLNEKIQNNLKMKIQEFNPKVVSVSGKFQIDFASGFSLDTLLVDFGQGQGENPLFNVGEGTKKRLFLVINEWDREIRLQGGPKKRIIRGYDEPDASLHYGAQKQMFYSLKKRSVDKEDKIQVVICTHSIAMVDRAPAGTINHLTEKDGTSSVNYLKSENDEEVKDFLDSISEISGIKNSSLFFERCFLIVEGDTEDNFLPRAYQRSQNRTLSEDGVVLINLKSNSSWQAFLKLLKKNKADATVLILDNDTQANADRRITREKLQEIGFNEAFLTNNVFLVGTTEFEDLFSNELVVSCLNKYWSKVTGEQWTPQEIQTLRTRPKFSQALVNYVNEYRINHKVSFKTFGKPEFGRKLGEEITAEEFNSMPAFQALITRIQTITK